MPVLRERCLRRCFLDRLVIKREIKGFGLGMTHFELDIEKSSGGFNRIAQMRLTSQRTLPVFENAKPPEASSSKSVLHTRAQISKQLVLSHFSRCFFARLFLRLSGFETLRQDLRDGGRFVEQIVSKPTVSQTFELVKFHEVDEHFARFEYGRVADCSEKRFRNEMNPAANIDRNENFDDTFTVLWLEVAWNFYG